MPNVFPFAVELVVAGVSVVEVFFGRVVVTLKKV